jgi:hypothetical protein
LGLEVGDAAAEGLQDLVEGDVVEVLDQLGVGDREGRDVSGEQLVVVCLCFCTGRLGSS